LFSHIALSSLTNNTSYEIPIAEIVKMIGNGLFYFFVLVIYGEIFTTLIGNFFGLKKQLIRIIPLSNNVILAILFVIITIISQFGYGSLVSILYPIFGYVSLTILFVLMIKALPDK
jgi:uncharacterized membrane protein YkvI